MGSRTDQQVVSSHRPPSRWDGMNGGGKVDALHVHTAGTLSALTGGRALMLCGTGSMNLSNQLGTLANAWWINPQVYGRG